MIILKDIGSRKSGRSMRPWVLAKCEDCGKEQEKRKDACTEKARCRSCSLKTHGLTKHRLFQTHANMLMRCNNPKDSHYINYGARGISVCDEWTNVVEFYNWAMANGYKDDLTIDRINNDGNYEPSNCRWTTRDIQQQNKRKLSSNNTTGYKNVAKKKNRYASYIRVSNKRIYIGSYMTAIEAASAYDFYVIKNNLEHTRNFEPMDYINKYLGRIA